MVILVTFFSCSKANQDINYTLPSDEIIEQDFSENDTSLEVAESKNMDSTEAKSLYEITEKETEYVVLK